ncbi:MAG: Holliday junction branch migration protein RuvA [Alkalispirochaeta sp.]
MFNSVAGRITGHDFPLLYVATGGIEWELEVSATTFQAALGADKTARRRFLIHLHTREDILKLYGFDTVAERSAFRELLKVAGIGPKQALRILSGTTVAALTELLEEEDVDALTRIPGLGRKTAQKMILQLKGHLVLEPEIGSGGGTHPGTPGDDLVAALVDMGFDRSAARNALQRLSTELSGEAGDAPDEQELFRRAIVALSGT